MSIDSKRGSQVNSMMVGPHVERTNDTNQGEPVIYGPSPIQFRQAASGRLNAPFVPLSIGVEATAVDDMVHSLAFDAKANLEFVAAVTAYGRTVLKAAVEETWWANTFRKRYE